MGGGGTLVGIVKSSAIEKVGRQSYMFKTVNGLLESSMLDLSPFTRGSKLAGPED